MNYLHWDEKTITDFSDKSVSDLYDKGYVFTRLGRGIMHQTRSVRINLNKFEMSSENRRILKKIAQNESSVKSDAAGPALESTAMPLPLQDYDFKLGKLAKDFYDTKFGPGIMSAIKVKEVLSDKEKSNFNLLLTYTLTAPTIGYAISFQNKTLLHYSYPFYDLNVAPKDMGLAMMIKAIQYAKDAGLKYIYLGSLQRPNDTYKLQFSGLEWFDGKDWQNDLEKVKKILKSNE